jgi:DNA-binding NtrC family response regulator
MKQFKKILLVDDDPDIRKLIAAFLPSDEYEVIQAADVDAAKCELAKGTYFDLAIFDFWLGKDNAISIMDSVMFEGRVLPVIIISGGNGRMDLEKTEAISDVSGAVVFLQKPFQKSALIDSIAAAIR